MNGDMISERDKTFEFLKIITNHRENDIKILIRWIFLGAFFLSFGSLYFHMSFFYGTLLEKISLLKTHHSFPILFDISEAKWIGINNIKTYYVYLFCAVLIGMGSFVGSLAVRQKQLKQHVEYIFDRTSESPLRKALQLHTQDFFSGDFYTISMTIVTFACAIASTVLTFYINIELIDVYMKIFEEASNIKVKGQ